MKFFVTLLLVSFSFAQLQANTFVGTGGEGTFVGRRFYLRDLYEYNLHGAPWVGSTVDPQIEEELGTWNPISLTPQVRNILLRKLTDANRAVPRLGSFLIMAIRFYDWSWTDLNLPVVPECDTRFEVPISQRIPIANRYMQSIVLKKNRFETLDQNGQAALIIHEALYSLVRLTQAQSGLCQSAETVRMLNAYLFTSADALEKLRKWAPALLNIPIADTITPGMKSCQLVSLKMSVQDPVLGFKTFSILELPFKADLRRQFLVENFKRAQKIQTSLWQIDNGTKITTPPLIANVEMPASFVLDPKIYQAENGLQVQLRIAIQMGLNETFSGESEIDEVALALDQRLKNYDCH